MWMVNNDVCCVWMCVRVTPKSVYASWPTLHAMGICFGWKMNPKWTPRFGFNQNVSKNFLNMSIPVVWFLSSVHLIGWDSQHFLGVPQSPPQKILPWLLQITVGDPRRGDRPAIGSDPTNLCLKLTCTMTEVSVLLSQRTNSTKMADNIYISKGRRLCNLEKTRENPQDDLRAKQPKSPPQR